MIDICNRTFNFDEGDGHIRSAWWQNCKRLKGHTGQCAEVLNNEQKTEDAERLNAERKRFRSFIDVTARRHRRRQYAERELERLLIASPDAEFTITVPVVIEP